MSFRGFWVDLVLVGVGFSLSWRAMADESRELKFFLSLASFVDSDSSLVAEFDGFELSIKRGEEALFNARVSVAQLQDIDAVLAGASPDYWSGFHVTDGIFDGFMVRFWGVIGDRELDFKGLNGGPSRLAGLMVVLDEIVGEKVFDGRAWAVTTADCRQYESQEAHMKMLEELAARRRVAEQAGDPDE